ncbi:type 2C protein phosphatase PTC5 [Kluyveromyces lactis]|uniref:KLLA0C13706p n=1 Tax=Kluyveromyces lactis (strain ATCC 8585 / CBS 2359 / DSM 70799 / NBRC 1267 / NRRL Y-1140 / WM37) TaxID=284590 RepID=Q6CTC7_KLULA|nr:uncharacterized protein KLLA0_C13706g [Kluyveromyces lactis]CAH01663.1 KLLA0C13706p [Kluyveromyces lactis]|eukprot:XP_452812.1 uncharacterized protein KLLA0_C13706g [Kluyveromyces lactis]
MPPPSLLQSRAARTLSRCLSKKDLSKMLFLSQRRQLSTSNQKRKSGLLRSNEWKYAVIGGALVLGYSYLTNYVSSDTINGIKHYSSGDGFKTGKSDPSSNTNSNTNTISLLNDRQVESILHKSEESYFVNRGKGILRYDVSQLPSNAPIEDNRVEQIITVPTESSESLEDLYFFGIFDGHGGPYTSAKLSQDLVPYVAHQLGQIYGKGVGFLTSESIDEAIMRGFLQLDNDIVYGSLGKLFEEPTKENLIESLPAVSGACSLLSMYDSNNCTLKVAVTGDSRAILVKQSDDGAWTVKSLSTDQTGDNVQEVERIQKEHPDEPNCVRQGRILGSLQPSRAFGDYRYKVKEINGKTVYDLPDHLKIYFRREPKDFLTPPYVTAKPEITTTNVDPKTKFMVLGSDGLFELLSNDEIAGLVVKWMESHPIKKNFKMLKEQSPQGKLPKLEDISPDKEAQRPAFRYQSSKKPDSKSEYLMQDENVATHLIRNALSGGGNKEYVSTLVSIPPTKSRRYRDDLTVTVVFFGEETEGIDGKLELNHKATKPEESKL